MTPRAPVPDASIAALMERLLLAVAREEALPDKSTPLGALTQEFFESNWENARTGLLARTTRVRVVPLRSRAPNAFRFEYDVPFKRKTGPGAPIELVPGPLRGVLRYRPDLFRAARDEATVLVEIDRDQALYHPNHSRSHACLCLGRLPTGPVPLDLEFLIEHLYRIVTYQNCGLSDPLDAEAAAWFASDPSARSGLEEVRPLY